MNIIISNARRSTGRKLWNLYRRYIDCGYICGKAPGRRLNLLIFKGRCTALKCNQARWVEKIRIRSSYAVFKFKTFLQRPFRLYPFTSLSHPVSCLNTTKWTTQCRTATHGSPVATTDSTLTSVPLLPDRSLRPFPSWSRGRPMLWPSPWRGRTPDWR